MLFRSKLATELEERNREIESNAKAITELNAKIDSLETERSGASDKVRELREKAGAAEQEAAEQKKLLETEIGRASCRERV